MIHMIKVKSSLLHAAAAAKLLQLCPTVRPHGLQPTRLLHPLDFPGKSTGVGCHCLDTTIGSILIRRTIEKQIGFEEWDQLYMRK